jgi:periplasmic protein CpxP/Spy
MSNDIDPIARAVAAGAILSALMLCHPAPAAAAPDQLILAQAAPALAPSATTPQSTAPQKAPEQAPAKAPHARMSPSARVEARIKDLHASLHITAAQETQWNGVAQAMRDNAKAIETVAADRTENLATMSAVDDLRSYESLSEVHADGLKKLVAAFAPLYDSMSDSQKKAADTLFRQHERHPTPAKKS